MSLQHAEFVMLYCHKHERPATTKHDFESSQFRRGRFSIWQHNGQKRISEEVSPILDMTIQQAKKRLRGSFSSPRYDNTKGKKEAPRKFRLSSTWQYNGQKEAPRRFLLFSIWQYNGKKRGSEEVSPLLDMTIQRTKKCGLLRWESRVHHYPRAVIY